jgi:WD40 repeat protein
MKADDEDKQDRLPSVSDPSLGPTNLSTPLEVEGYEILRVLGEGGMGVVYLARQQVPVQRQVALKIVKPGMDSKQVVARFETERQALALLDHPNIAQVYDAGTTKDGHPYFSMEYVEGLPITEYCDKHRFSIEERLQLFVQVCEGVQHAHQKGIIHRDIKPSNVLVYKEGDKPLPKIIDFGVAKALTVPLTEKTFFTEQGQLLGTPEYMSPEQAEMTMHDIDTRSDIYSLGIVLYELLTGALPFERKTLQQVGFTEILRTIREQDPPRPSARLSSLGADAKLVANSRRTQVGTLVKRLHNELEWIPLKAMRKERSHRYESSTELARDIQRYLKGDPLIAGPESAVYRTKKFFRRNRAIVVGAITVLVVLVGGIVISTIFAMGEARARSDAERSEKHADEQRNLAQQKAESYRRLLYINSIALADAKYAEGNTSQVRQLLESCPNDLRGWEWYRLNYISDQSVMTLRGHKNWVTIVAFSPNGNHIISGDTTNRVRVWDTANYNKVSGFRGYVGGVCPVAFCPDGKQVAIGILGREDNIINIWDPFEGTVLKAIPQPDRTDKTIVASIAFSADGKRIASGCWDNTIKVWDAFKGTIVTTIKLPSRTIRTVVYSIVISPDGRNVFSVWGQDSIIEAWDAETGTRLMTLRGHQRDIKALAFSPDGRHIVSGSSDKMVKVWDVIKGIEVVTFEGHKDSVESVAFSPGSRLIASGSGDNTIKVWDAATGANVMTLHGHDGPVYSVAFSKNGKQIVSGSADKTVRIWDVTINKEVAILRSDRWESKDDVVYSIAVSPDGTRLVSGHIGMVKVWDLTSATEVMTLRGHDTRGGIWSVTFSADGKRIASCGAVDQTIRVWDAASGTELLAIPCYEKRFTSVSFSPDGKRIASGGEDGKVKIWDSVTGSEVISIDHGGGVSMVAFNSNGKRIASCGPHKMVGVWDVETGAEVMSVKGWGTHLAFSPGGECIASCGNDQIVKVWDTETGAEIMELDGYGSCIAFSPDGKRIASGSSNNTIKVWDVGTGAEVLTLRGHENKISTIAFTPDGSCIISGSYDGSIRLWESVPPTGGYKLRHTGETARKLVEDLYQEYNSYEEVIKKLQADRTLNDSARKMALHIANSRKWEETP